MAQETKEHIKFSSILRAEQNSTAELAYPPTFSRGWEHLEVDGGGSCTLPKDGNSGCISPKPAYVVLHPVEGLCLVLQTHVTR